MFFNIKYALFTFFDYMLRDLRALSQGLEFALDLIKSIAILLGLSH